MSAGDELNAFSPATTILRALASRRISAVELLEGYLRRVTRYDGTLNSIVIGDIERRAGTQKKPMSAAPPAKSCRCLAFR